MQIQKELEQTRSHCDSLIEWDRALREKIQKLEARLEKADSSLCDQKRASKTVEEHSRSLEYDLNTSTRMLAAANKQCLELQARVDDATAQLNRDATNSALVKQAMETLALDHKEKVLSDSDEGMSANTV